MSRGGLCLDTSSESSSKSCRELEQSTQLQPQHQHQLPPPPPYSSAKIPNDQSSQMENEQGIPLTALRPEEPFLRYYVQHERDGRGSTTIVSGSSEYYNMKLKIYRIVAVVVAIVLAVTVASLAFGYFLTRRV